jgi:hypothetical protein
MVKCENARPVRRAKPVKIQSVYIEVERTCGHRFAYNPTVVSFERAINWGCVSCAGQAAERKAR